MCRSPVSGIPLARSQAAAMSFLLIPRKSWAFEVTDFPSKIRGGWGALIWALTRVLTPAACSLLPRPAATPSRSALRDAYMSEASLKNLEGELITGAAGSPPPSPPQGKGDWLPCKPVLSMLGVSDPVLSMLGVSECPSLREGLGVGFECPSLREGEGVGPELPLL